jgi:hypothetical protein
MRLFGISEAQGTIENLVCYRFSDMTKKENLSRSYGLGSLHSARK